MFTLNARLHHHRRSNSAGSSSYGSSDLTSDNDESPSSSSLLPPSPALAPTSDSMHQHRRVPSNNTFLRMLHKSGGKKPSQPHMPSLDLNDEPRPQEEQGKPPQLQTQLQTDLPTYLQPAAEGEVRLTIVQITDVYTLDNFASLKTLLGTLRSSQNCGQNNSSEVVAMLTGDFLSPYLLSSVDRGAGMMDAITQTPIDVLTWGNHEADIDHKTVCRHARNFAKSGGTFINSNMQEHEAMDAQVPYEIIELKDADTGATVKKIGLVAVLSNDPKLYSHFPKPGAFGGAKIEDPWETLAYYKNHLENDCGCDLVIPLEHLYMSENQRTCEQFNFPVILSGHDHHRIDQVVNGTRVIKPGMDGEFCTVLEIVFKKGQNSPPKIRSSFVKVSDYEPDAELKEKTDRAYDVLLPLRNTELAGILPQYKPLTSKDARGSTCTMGKLVCSLLKSALDQTQKRPVDAVVLMGGNIRGGEDYDDSTTFFSLEMLEAEIKADEVIGIVDCPGDVLARGIESTHVEGTPRPGWFQYDDGVAEVMQRDGVHYQVTRVAGQPVDPNKTYRIATKISDLTNGQSPPLKEYFLEHPEALPSKGDYVNIQSELMGFFARSLWRRLWDVTGERMSVSASTSALNSRASTAALTAATSSSSSDDDDDEYDDCNSDDDALASVDESRLRLDVLDRDGDGYVSVNDIHYALKNYLGLSVDDSEKTLAKAVHSHADTTGDGTVSVDDFEVFCTGMPKEYRPIPKWANAFCPSPNASATDLKLEEAGCIGSNIGMRKYSDLEVDL